MTRLHETDEMFLKKAAAYCAEQERCISQVRHKLGEWRASDKVILLVLEYLDREGFLDEQRFARAYATSKFHQLKWGKIKIQEGLRYLHLQEKDIVMGLEAIDNEEYLTVLEDLIRKKTETTKDPNRFIRSRKVANFAISKGYEPELVWRIVRGESG
jgi:regulatory protein